MVLPLFITFGLLFIALTTGGPPFWWFDYFEPRTL